MRYYSLEITSVATGKVIRSWQSHPQGTGAAPDPGSLQVEFDLIVSAYAIASGDSVGGGDFGNSFIRVWGIPIADIAQASNLSAPTGATPTYKAVLKGGMAKGLPLANPSQAGTLVQGYIWRAIGNWVGLDMTLDLYLSALPVTETQTNANLPKLPLTNFTFFAQGGQPLANAIQTTFQAAYPGVPINIAINPTLVAPFPLIHIAGTLQQFSDYLNKQTVALIGAANKGYQGVQTFLRNGAITISDGTTENAQSGGTAAPKFNTVAIKFTDLIGQPTWLGNNVIQVTTVMRGDIQINDKVTLPVGLTTIGAAGALNNTDPTFSQGRFSSQFQGNFTVREVRHVGNYKAPQATSWISVFTASQNPGPVLPSTTPAPASPAATPAPLQSVS